MSFHPSAIERFNARAVALRPRVRTTPLTQPPAPAFSPDIVSTHLSTGDFSRMVYSSRGPGGRVNGHYLRKDNQLVGVFDEDFEELKSLSASIQQAGNAKRLLSVEFVFGVLFDWLTSPEGASGSPIDFLLKSGNAAITEQDIWVPIADFYPEVEFDLGIAMIRRFTKELFELSVDSAAATNDKEQLPALSAIFEKERRRVQGLGAVSIRVRAEPGHAIAIAHERADLAISVIRFFSPVNTEPSAVSYWMPLGQEPKKVRLAYQLNDGRIVATRSAAVDAERVSLLEKRAIEHIQRLGLEKLAGILRKDTQSEFEQTVLRTVVLFSRGALTNDPTQRLIYQFAALEGLLLKNTSEPIQQSMSDRMAFFATTDPDARERVMTSVRNAYQLRSQFLHHARLNPNIDTLTRFARNAWQFLLLVIKRADVYATRDDFFSDIEDVRLGRRKEPRS